MNRGFSAAMVAGLVSGVWGQGVELRFEADRSGVPVGGVVRWTVYGAFTGYDPSAYFGGVVGDFPATDPGVGVSGDAVVLMAGVALEPTTGVDAGVTGVNIFNSALLATNDPTNPLAILSFEVTATQPGLLDYTASGVVSVFPSDFIFEQPDEYPDGEFGVVSDVVVIGESYAITINEALGSTSSADREFIELYNAGGMTVDLTGWSIELWDSDVGGFFGEADGASPYTLAGSVEPGDFFTIANELAETEYGFTADQVFGSNSIENSSYTMVLRDSGGDVVQTIFVTDGGVGDTPNIAGAPVAPDLVAGPDETFIPAGFYRVSDGAPTVALLEFAQPSASATPDASNGGGEPQPCNASDLAEPFGALSGQDICAFLQGFLNQMPPGDFDDDGEYDLADLALFVEAFLAGCP